MNLHQTLLAAISAGVIAPAASQIERRMGYGTLRALQVDGDASFSLSTTAVGVEYIAAAKSSKTSGGGKSGKGAKSAGGKSGKAAGPDLSVCNGPQACTAEFGPESPCCFSPQACVKCLGVDPGPVCGGGPSLCYDEFGTLAESGCCVGLVSCLECEAAGDATLFPPVDDAGGCCNSGGSCSECYPADPFDVICCTAAPAPFDPLDTACLSCVANDVPQNFTGVVAPISPDEGLPSSEGGHMGDWSNGWN